MAQLAIAVAGAAVGFAIGGPAGARLGFFVGSVVGGYVAAPDTQGPRLSESTVQISSYGAAIAEVWGGGRLAGNIIWSTDLVESESSDSAGKGGPEVTTYTYSVSCAVAICEGPIGGIRRIWADAKLVYDAREGSDAATQAASTAFASYMTVYTGTESQMPDATIEAIEGAGNVEAYRGTAYVVFSGLPLADYGNRVPNFQFEVTTEPLVTDDLESLIPFVVDDWTLDGEDAPSHGTRPAVYDQIRYVEVGSETTIAGTFDTLQDALEEIQSGYPEYQHVVCWSHSDNALPNVFDGGAALSDDPEYCYIYVGIQPVRHVIDLQLSGGGTVQYSNSMYTYGMSPEVPPYDLTDDNTVSLMLESWRDNLGVYVHDGTGLMRLVWGTSFVAAPEGYSAIAQAEEYEPDFPQGYFPTVVQSPLIRIRVKRTPYVPENACEIGDPAELGIAQLPSSPSLCISSNGDLSNNFAYVEEAGTFKQLQQVTYASGILSKNGLGPVLRSSDPNYNSSAFWTAAAAAAGVSGTYGVDFPVTVSEIGVGDATYDQAEAGQAVLSDIVEDLCNDAGLEDSQIDVSALTDIVQGYIRTRVMSARSAIEPLRQAFFFDAVESGDVIRFVKRGGASISTVAVGDLGAGQDAPGEPIEHERAQQTELPDSMAVAYQSPTADYQVGVQQSARRAGGSQQAMQVELPIVLNDLKAAEVADVLLYDAWSSRTTRRASVTLKHAFIEPTDIITIEDDEGSYRVRVIDKVQQAGVIRLECRDEDASAYVTNSTAGAVSGGGSTVRFDGPTLLALLDIPLLRDADDSAGYYAAASGYRSTWRGARAFRSADAGTSYSSVLDMNVRSVIGFADTELQAHSGGNTVDELNTVDVTIIAGTLSSITRDALLSGGNACLLGDEVLQFQRATLQSGTTYRLSGLLRARVGADDDTHAAGERFVLLSSSTTYRINAPLTELNRASVWKAVTFGDTLDEAFAVNFTNHAIGSAPLAPVHLFAASLGGSPAQDWAVQWVRQTRIGALWRDFADASLGEASEQYVVEVRRDGVLISSETVTTTSATVEAFPGDVVRVAQVSALVGPGFFASFTLT